MPSSEGIASTTSLLMSYCTLVNLVIMSISVGMTQLRKILVQVEMLRECQVAYISGKGTRRNILRQIEGLERLRGGQLPAEGFD